LKEKIEQKFFGGKQKKFCANENVEQAVAQN
jgi:hypothetical protein